MLFILRQLTTKIISFEKLSSPVTADYFFSKYIIILSFGLEVEATSNSELIRMPEKPLSMYWGYWYIFKCFY